MHYFVLWQVDCLHHNSNPLFCAYIGKNAHHFGINRGPKVLMQNRRNRKNRKYCYCYFIILLRCVPDDLAMKSNKNNMEFGMYKRPVEL